MRWLALPLCLVISAALGGQDPTEACLRTLADDARFAPIMSHVALVDAKDAGAGMLADPALPGALEREAIAAWAQARQDCVAAGAGFRRENHPAELAAITGDAERRVGAAVTSLANGKLAYGEFNRQRIDIANDEAAIFKAAVARLRHQRQISGRGQQRTFELDRLKADRDTVHDRQAALAMQRGEAISRGMLGEAARQTTENLHALHARDALERRRLMTEFWLNTTRPPYDTPVPPLSQVPPNLTCRPVGNTWTCAAR